MSEKKKMGRPKIQNPRNKRVEIRFNDEELELLDNIAEKYHTDRAGAIRLALKKIK